jgi:Ca2+-binding RTX toxin-like protein
MWWLAAASPFDVVVGSSGSDTVSLATLGSLATATPTFVYGLAGKDTINGTGMTGELWFVGGKGADTMTGGSGVNDYLYGATSDSTAHKMDIIANFDVTKDLIDLTGIGGSALAYAGQITGTKLAAHSVGWKPIGGNTFVYVNTSGSSESITGTNMKIELLGSLSLTSSNILHH